MKRILIDGRFVGVGDSIARYTLEILRGILELDKVNEYTLLIRPCGEKQSQISNLKSQNDNLKIKILDIPHYSLAEQTTLLSYLNKEKFDLVHFTQFNHPIFYRGKFIVTIHDLILLKSGQNPTKKLFFNLVMKDAVKKSQQIISVSETTKKDIVQIYGTDPDKIETIYHGIQHDKFHPFSPDTRYLIYDTLKKFNIGENFLLYVGAWKSHKNLRRLLQAFNNLLTRQLINSSTQLVLVGKIDHDEPEIVEKIESINNSALSPASPAGGSKFSAPVVATGPVDINSDELPALYAGAKAYVIPSLLEGFGWPPLEAMACGTPVVASETSCIPEILGDAAIYFNPLSVDDMTQKIKKVITNPEFAKELSEKGLKQSAKYTWAKTVQKTMSTYRNVLD